ncbi:MAG: hypothetical protein WCD53_17535 [Microcoleus sp.]
MFGRVKVNYNLRAIGTQFLFGRGLIIITGTIQHTKPLPDQDNTIVYEPAEKPFWLTE